MSQGLTYVYRTTENVGIRYGSRGKNLSSSVIDDEIAALMAPYNAKTNMMVSICDVGLTSFPRACFNTSTLVTLSLCGNCLTELPQDLYKIPNMKMLNVSRNLLVTLPRSIGQCVDLEQLHVQHNNLLWVPPTLTQCKKLNRLNICDNPRLRFAFSEILDGCAIGTLFPKCFNYDEARSSVVALLVLSKRKTCANFRLHKDVVRHVIAFMLYETRDEEEWRRQ